MKYPLPIQNLINQFLQLPTVGPKTAERYVFYLLKQSNEKLQEFAQYLAEIKEKTILCKECYAISESSPCSICTNKGRDNKTICLVAETQDMSTIEAMKQYNGKYHVLGGLINAIEGIGPENLKIKEFVEKIKKNQTEEIILALDPTIEGETTTLYLAKLIKSINADIKITKLAKGLPTGASLEYADEMTLSNALKYRNKI